MLKTDVAHVELLAEERGAVEAAGARRQGVVEAVLRVDENVAFEGGLEGVGCTGWTCVGLGFRSMGTEE